MLAADRSRWKKSRLRTHIYPRDVVKISELLVLRLASKYYTKNVIYQYTHNYKRDPTTFVTPIYRILHGIYIMLAMFMTRKLRLILV